MIADSSQSLQTFPVHTESLDPAGLHLDPLSVMILSGSHVAVIIEPELMHRLIRYYMGLSGLNVDTSKRPEYRTVVHA